MVRSSSRGILDAEGEGRRPDLFFSRFGFESAEATDAEGAGAKAEAGAARRGAGGFGLGFFGKVPISQPGLGSRESR